MFLLFHLITRFDRQASYIRRQNHDAPTMQPQTNAAKQVNAKRARWRALAMAVESPEPG